MTTVTTDGMSGQAELKAFAFSEARELARRTCASLPTHVLVRAFARYSSELPFGPDLRHYDDNAVALLYAEDIGMDPIQLQRAAYKGCSAGLNVQAD